MCVLLLLISRVRARAVVCNPVMSTCLVRIFVECHRADSVWSRSMFALSALFPDFASFYTFMAQKEHASTQTHVITRALSPLPSPSEQKDRDRDTQRDTQRDAVTAILPPNARVISPPLSASPLSPTQTTSTATQTMTMPKVKVPYFGNASVVAAVKGVCLSFVADSGVAVLFVRLSSWFCTELEKMCQSRSLKAKLEAVVRCRAIIGSGAHSVACFLLFCFVCPSHKVNWSL